MYEIKIGPVLKRVLRVRGLRLKEVSKATGIPYSTLHTWYENRQPKDILKAQVLADFLKLTLHELLFDQPDSREQKPLGEIPKQIGDEFFKGKFEIIVRRLSD
jgi:transcriptional regulator with XRE-family HTH domain